MPTIMTTKTLRVLQASATNAAGATTTGTSFDLTTVDGGLATLRITNTANGPTIPCTGYLEYSPDNTTWYTLYSIVGLTSNNGDVISPPIPVHKAIRYIRTRFTANTVNSVTIYAFFQENTNYVSV